VTPASREGTESELSGPLVRRSVSAYKKHKASGQAVVKLSGQVFYLGRHGTKLSLAEYDRVVAERWAEEYYRKDDKPTSELACILSAVRLVKQLYGREPVGDFGPLKLQAIRQAMIIAGWTRKNINKQVQRIVRKTCATYYDEHMPESSIEILGHSVGGITYRHYAHRAPLAFKAIMTLPQPSALSPKGSTASVRVADANPPMLRRAGRYHRRAQR